MQDSLTLKKARKFSAELQAALLAAPSRVLHEALHLEEAVAWVYCAHAERFLAQLDADPHRDTNKAMQHALLQVGAPPPPPTWEHTPELVG